MSSIRVSGNTSGHYDLTVPDVAGSNTIALDKIVVTDSNGNVGIGTTSPVYKLHVNSGATNVVADFESTDGIAGIRLQVEMILEFSQLAALRNLLLKTVAMLVLVQLVQAINLL
jgi:hypothetical protein